jgi:hypothetical protein
MRFSTFAFIIKLSPWALSQDNKVFLILLRVREDVPLCNRRFSCMRCQWHHTHNNVFVDSKAVSLIILTFRSCSKISFCMHRACGLNDPTWIVHAVSMKPHAYRKFRISSRIRIYMPLNQELRTDVLMKKNRGLKISRHCLFKNKFVASSNSTFNFASSFWPTDMHASGNVHDLRVMTSVLEIIASNKF